MGQIIDKAVSWAAGIAGDAAHGYDQGNRWGPDYDCSALVISAWEQAGVPVKSQGATYTGNMRGAFLSCGFADVTGSVDLRTGGGLAKGDVLLNEQSHTALYIGAGQLVQASGNELGGVTGGQTGDQTGREINISGYYNFPWDCVLRYQETPEGQVSGGKVTYTVQQGDSLWSIAEKMLGYGWLYTSIKEANGLTSDVIHPGQVLKMPGTTPEERVALTVTVARDIYDRLNAIAQERGITVEEAAARILSGASQVLAGG